MGVETSDAPRFTLLTRAGCHLCDVMESRLRGVLTPRHLAWASIDVDTDERLLELYGDTVPVLFLDDREVARVRLSSKRLSSIVDGLVTASQDS